ncbi:MAG TPA: hypothetical protein VG318_10715 [Actinomycetota bacterium]|nr:hypothetical protein [Actinomycetota bacterium]
MFSRRRIGPDGPPAPGLAAGRRTLVLLIAVAVVGAPAGVLRAFCAGHSCDEPANASSEVPFCSLPDDVRTRVAAGFREGRSPDVLAVARNGIASDEEWPRVPWPSTAGAGTRVPLAFWGTGVEGGAEIPPGTGLDDVAPTIESILGFERPHPDVRSGTAIEGVASGEAPRLVVEIVWVGRGSRDLDAAAGRYPYLAAAMDSGAATVDADTVSLPVDPVAVLTTIGTGGRPAQHGITGAVVRDDEGRVRRAWSPSSPLSVIATLGDDLDEAMGQDPVVGTAAARRGYLGAVGGNWHVDVDRDVFVKTRRGDEARDGVALLRQGFGRDEVPDLAVVAVESGAERLDATVRAVVRAAERASGGSAAFVFTATGASAGDGALPAEDLPGMIPGEDMASLVEEVVPGGLFLDQKVLAERQVSEDEVLRALAQVRSPAAGPLFADVFPAIAVAFGRYC